MSLSLSRCKEDLNALNPQNDPSDPGYVESCRNDLGLVGLYFHCAIRDHLFPISVNQME